jgi:hypothetical protein
MNRTKSTVVAIVFFVLGAVTAWIEEPLPTVTLSVGEIARQVQLRNLEIFKAARDVERARKDLAGEPELMDSSLSVGSGYGSSGFGASGWYGQSSLTLRLLPQLSAATSLVVEQPGVLGESVSLTVKPFEPSRQTYSEEKALGSAVVRERYLKHQIYLDAEQAALNLLIGDMERELARATEDLQQKKYELVQRQQEIGEASFQDVQDQLVDLIDAREDLFSKESGYLGDWRTLQLLFAPGEERINVAPLPIAELMRMVEKRRAQVKPFDQSEPVTEDLENLRLELAALEAELKATPAWRPELSLSTAVDFPYAYPGSHSMSVGLSFSPNQLKRDEREDLQEDIEIKHMEIAAETSAAALQKSLELQNIALVGEALASAQIQEERDRVSLQEAELLFQQGRRTTLELEQLRLNLKRTQILNFRSAAEVYRVLGVYQMLFVGE